MENTGKVALKRARKAVRKMGWLEIIDPPGSIKKNKGERWQVTIKVGFTIK